LFYFYFFLKTVNTYRRIAAFLLAALVFQVVALKEIHHLFEHCHDEVAHCTDSGSNTHLHNEDYHFEDCFVCVFHFAPTVLDFQEIHLTVPSPQTKEAAFSYQNRLTSRVNWHFLLRGPPSLAA